MQELTMKEVEQVEGGVAFLGWAAYGAFQVAMFGARAAASNPGATATAVGVVVGWLSEG